MACAKQVVDRMVWLDCDVMNGGKRQSTKSIMLSIGEGLVNLSSVHL